jgi:hypothetical protein
MWIIISRVNGFHGQLLSDSLAQGFDGFRCWLSSYLIWANRSSSFPADSLRSTSSHNPSSNVWTMQQAVVLLTDLLENPAFKLTRTKRSSSSTLSADEDDDILRFLRDSCAEIEKKRIEIASNDGIMVGAQAGLHPWPLHNKYNQNCLSSMMHCLGLSRAPASPVAGTMNTSPYSPIAAGNDNESGALRRNSGSEFELVNAPYHSNSSNNNSPLSTSTSSSVERSEEGNAPRVAFACRSVPGKKFDCSPVSEDCLPSLLTADTSIGYLIPFNTGHNGWPREPELGHLKAFLKFAGFLDPV